MAAHSKKDFHVAKKSYDKAKEAMEKLLSRYGELVGLLEDYALLLVKMSAVELALGNFKEARGSIEKSIEYNPTAEVSVHVMCESCCYHQFYGLDAVNSVTYPVYNLQT